MFRSRRELSNAYLLAKFGLDTAKNEPCKVCPIVPSGRAGETEQLQQSRPDFAGDSARLLVAEFAAVFGALAILMRATALRRAPRRRPQKISKV